MFVTKLLLTLQHPKKTQCNRLMVVDRNIFCPLAGGGKRKRPHGDTVHRGHPTKGYFLYPKNTVMAITTAISASLNTEEISTPTKLFIQSYNLLTAYYDTMFAALTASNREKTQAERENHALEQIENYDEVGSVLKSLEELQAMTKQFVCLSLDKEIW